MPEILILGASYTGIPAAHRFLRALPDHKVTLVNPSTDLYWNPAAPRAIAKDHAFSENNNGLFEPFLPAFDAYPKERFEFIQGTATALDPVAKTVTVLADREIVLNYDHLVITTGARTIGDTPFKKLGSTEETRKALAEYQQKIQAAKTIVLSGAGPTGVETTGEIATLFKGQGKKIYLLDPSEGPLPMLKESVREEARKQLESLGVTVLMKTSVTKETDGKLELSNGQVIEADLHIPTYGLIPNTKFVPKEMLDQTGSVKVDKHMRSTEYPNIWAAGDVASVKFKSLLSATPMSDAMTANFISVAQGGEVVKEYKDDMTPMVVPIGGGFAMGTGQMFGWRVLGLLVWLVKGRSYFIGKAKSTALAKEITGGKV
jgi:NADH dehydrogenase FAD-containing subunit